MNGNLNRRDFLKTMGMGTAMLALPGCLFAAKKGSGDKKPNVLFILAIVTGTHSSSTTAHST